MLIIFILIGINIPYTTSETYKEQEFFTEQEPYNTSETVTEKVPYLEDVPLNLSTRLDWFIADHRFNNEFDLIAVLNNTDNASGEFWVKFHVESTNGSYNFTSDKILLAPNASYQIKQKFSGIFSYFTYLVKQPTRKEQRYREVSYEKPVTKYQDVVKSREINKVRRIHQSLLQRLLKYPVTPEPEPPPVAPDINNMED